MTEDLTALSERLAGLSRAMAAPLPSAEDLTAAKAEDRALAERICKARPGVPLHHAYAVLETLRTIQRVEAAKAEPETDVQLHRRMACPGWEYAVTEGPRKQWDDADRPPSDEHGDPDPSWERNTDAGRDGWERFDYTEESYWRRRKPTGA